MWTDREIDRTDVIRSASNFASPLNAFAEATNTNEFVSEICAFLSLLLNLTTFSARFWLYIKTETIHH